MDEEQERGPVTSREPFDPPTPYRPPRATPPRAAPPPPPPQRVPVEPGPAEAEAARGTAHDEAIGEILAEVERDPYSGLTFGRRLRERIVASAYRLRRHPVMALVLTGSLAAGIAVAVTRSSAGIDVYLVGALIGIAVGYSMRFVQETRTYARRRRLRIRYDTPLYEAPEYVYRRLLSDALLNLYLLHNAAHSFAHPLLAAEIKDTEEAVTRALNAPGDDFSGQTGEIADSIAALRKRVRKAEWAYRLNLPLTREAAANFAAARMAGRIARLAEAMSSYAPPARGGSHG